MVGLTDICVILAYQVARRRAVIRTLKHVLDEYRALSDLLVDDKLLIIGSDEKNHGD